MKLKNYVYTYFSPQAEQDLLELAESKLSDLNLTQYTQLMQEQITNLDLDMFIRKLKRVQGRLGRDLQSSAVRAAIGNEILYLEQMKRVVVELQMGIRQVSPLFLTASIQWSNKLLYFLKWDMFLGL